LDMVGSVWEWCEDWYDERYYENSPSRNPSGPSSGRARVTRGGDWLNAYTWTRVAYRHAIDPSWGNARQGFRCVHRAPDNAPNDAVTFGVEGARTIPDLHERSEKATEVARPSSQQLKIELEIVSNPIDSHRGDRCVVSSHVESGGEKRLWGSFGEARLRESGELTTLGATTRCGVGAFDNVGEVPGKNSGFPLLIVEPTVSMGKPGAVAQTSLAEISLMLLVRRFSGVSGGGKPVYTNSSETRILRFEASGETIVPVLVPTGKEKEALGVHEVLLRVRAKQVGPPVSYGVVSLATDAPATEVLLEGGVVGHTSEQGVLVLRNVPAGERELRARDTTGHEVRRTIDVVADRTVAVALHLPKRGPSTLAGAPAAIGVNSQGYREYRRERDGAVMIDVPEGEFLMGNLETEGHPLPHKVNLSEFLIDKIPVTSGQYEKFCRETARLLPPEPYWGFHDDHPVSFVSWEDSTAYCEWAGGRLPTEAEREKAARGTDQRKYPWGDEEPTPDRAVFRHNWGYVATEPPGSHPAGASPYGGLDMGGNMWEWCQDWYDSAYYETSPAKDPRGPRSGRAHVVRGGSWDSRPSVLSCSCRNWGYVGYREGDYGFRCAAEVPSASASPRKRWTPVNVFLGGTRNPPARSISLRRFGMPNSFLREQPSEGCRSLP
jgi:formylglycine-generating enzyme required for sulfatase activity